MSVSPTKSGTFRGFEDCPVLVSNANHQEKPSFGGFPKKHTGVRTGATFLVREAPTAQATRRVRNGRERGSQKLSGGHLLSPKRPCWDMTHQTDACVILFFECPTDVHQVKSQRPPDRKGLEGAFLAGSSEPFLQGPKLLTLVLLFR